MSISITDMRTKFKVYAEDDTISTSIIDRYFNDAYLEFYGKVKWTPIMEEYATDSVETTTADSKGTYITTPIAWLLGYKLAWNSVKRTIKSWTDYKLYTLNATNSVDFKRYDQVEELETWDSTIFSNKAIDNIVIYLAVASYFEHSLNQTEKSNRMETIARAKLIELGDIGEQQSFIISSSYNEIQEPNLW